MKKLIIVTAFLLSAITSKATIYSVSSGLFSDINVAIGMAVANDTIVVSGTYSIYPGYVPVFIDKSLTLLSNGAELDGAGLLVAQAGKRLMVISNASDVLVDGFVFKNLIGNFSIGIEIMGIGNNITIQHCLITNIGWTSNNLSIYPSDSNNNANGILVHGTTGTILSNVHILEDTITNCALGYSEALTIAGNTANFSVIGNVVYANSNIGIDIAGHTNLGTNPPDKMNFARQGLIKGNIVYRNMSPVAVSAGIYLDGAFNCIVDGNIVFNNGAGISVGQERMTGVGAQPCSKNKIINNFIYNNAIYGLVLGSELFPTNPQTINNYIGGNVLFKNRTGTIVNGINQVGPEPAGTANGSYGSIFGGEIQLMNSDSNIIENNILYPLGPRRCINAPDTRITTDIIIRYNNLYKETGAPYFDIGSGAFVNGHTGGNQNIITTGLIENSLSVYPEFLDSLNHDFHLEPTSLCRDMGNPTTSTVAAGLYDFYNDPRIFNGRIDIGAAELQSFALSFENEIVKTSGFDVQLFPNPGGSILFFKSNRTIIEVSIIDVSGHIVNKMKVPGKKIDVNALPTGIYHLQFVAENGDIQMKKFVRR